MGQEKDDPNPAYMGGHGTTVRCIECGVTVSGSQAACPHCGHAVGWFSYSKDGSTPQPWYLNWEPDAQPSSNEQLTAETAERQPKLGRRAVLGGVAATAAATFIPVGAAAETVDIVEAGADPNGEEAIDSVLNDVAGPGKTIEFPPGEYKLHGFSSSADGLTLTGVDATLKYPDDGGTILQMSGDDWTVNGFEFDYSGTEEHPTVNLNGSGWTFSNVVFRGTDSGRDAAFIYPSIPSGATGTMHMVYLHEGNADPDERQGGKAMWSNDLEGTLVMDGIWVEQFAENSLYLSNNSGSVVTRNSFFRNTNSGMTRITDTSLVENTTYVKDGLQPAQKRDNGAGSRDAKGIWWNAEKGYFGGDVEIKNCDFVWTSDEGSGPMVDATDGDGGALQVYGCNMHNETSSPTIWSEGHDVDIQDTSITGNKNLNLSGNVENKDVHSERTADPSPPIPDPPEPGTTPNSEGTTSTTETATPTETETSSLSNEIIIDGSGDPDNSATYEFTVSGDLELGQYAEDPDSVSGSTASGVVENQQDSYNFSGDVTDFTVDGNVAVTVNGESVDISSLESTGSTSPVAEVWTDGEFNRVELSKSSGTANYEIVVDGDVEPGPRADLDDNTDSFSQNADGHWVIDGLLEGGTDNWDVLGKVVSATFDSGISMTVNGTSFDTADLEGVGTAPDETSTETATPTETETATPTETETATPTPSSTSTPSPRATTSHPNTIVIDGAMSEGTWSEYTFTVKGNLEKAELPGTSVNEDDVISGRTVEGQVRDGADAYRFNGNIEELQITGGATVEFNDAD